MPAINPTPDQLVELSSQVPDGQRIVMINLLRFREWAAYPPGSLDGKHTGRQAYELYSQNAMKYLAQVGGRPIWRGQARFTVIAPADEKWDEAILVEYPSRRSFERMIANPGYLAGVHHRTAALDDSRLIATVAPQRIGRVAWWIYRLVRRRRIPSSR